MGMQGPLTAQALGRSPYDDVVEGEGEANPHEPAQQYDYAGRPINPNTARINRDIIRSHNQVMLVIGVAEPENANSGQEAESRCRHGAYEQSMGQKLTFSARQCVEAVGVFGVTGLRDRILIYKRYSEIPFWDLYQQARSNFSLSRDILPGAPASFLASYIDHYASRLWLGDKHRRTARRWVLEIWSYVRTHLELYVAMQRLGLIPGNQWLPNPSFFIPFSEASPIMAPPSLENLTLPSILRWLSSALVYATPFLVWAMTQRVIRDAKPQIWAKITPYLPSTVFGGKLTPLGVLSTSPLPVNGPPSGPPGIEDGAPPSAAAAVDDELPNGSGPVEGVRRPSIFSLRGDGYSDDDENDGVRATLISFDVEATESTDAPPGLWSAELRPSLTTDSKTSVNLQPVYFDTLITRVPALMASYIFTNAISRILITPYEAAALRLNAHAFRLRQGLPCEDFHNLSILSGLTWTSAINYLGAELLHLILDGEVWAVFTNLAQWFHMSEEEWKAQDVKN